MIRTLIIGKESNLSRRIFSSLDDCILISARDILKNIDILEKHKDENINIIFNNFQPAVELNILDSSKNYINSAIVITSMVLDYFSGVDIKKIIYTSSSSVYGSNILCNENDELKPMNLHASLKIANEKLIEKYCSQRDIDYTIARIFNMYGGDDKFSVISKIIAMHREGKELTIVNNGNAIRDFIHINNVVDIYKALLSKKDIKVINIGTGNGNSIKNIIDFLSNNNIKIKTNNIFKDELKTSTADARLLFNIIGKVNFIKIEEYLKEQFNL